METPYPGLEFGPAELAAVMRGIYDELIEFATTPAFQSMYFELMSLPTKDRFAFVLDVVLSPEERRRRGVEPPDGILIQTSAFGDRRPTLFVIKKFLPQRYHTAWENLNITFDNHYDDKSVSRDPGMAWRPPLPVALQGAVMSGGVDLDSLPNDIGVGSALFELPEIRSVEP
ncbi:hypothetical protein [Hyphomicrobium facile]|uniref:Uncharacterized protein n=1 Tax=Hyphomicrobium facile TaxID=51670 RepID=A0A1I7NQR4_9HYPH|nr:hypothetical protein [Hyphomicrobium facile]SFV37031.1 hypothetical protein SAMN04488557_2958 [Hyphomicrobium facile]